MLSSQEVTTLPKLRQDIQLIQSSPDHHGELRWMLFDPISHRYFALSHEALPLIRHWQDDLDINTFLQKLPSSISHDLEEIQAFIQFLMQNHLVQHITGEQTQHLIQQYKKQQHHWLHWLIHNYLFIKVPLLRPNDLLDWLFPKVSLLFHPNTRTIILTLGIIGILLTLHQWDTFATTFLHFFTWQGLALYGITLAGVKILHEFGHALVSRKHNCRVSSMGIAFLVMFPVLYTDTTDAWRLKSKAQRLDIVTAGMRVEIYLALIATFLWSFLPDGSLKSAAFFIATTSWITSLMINLSPFLRFDGYYAFSDWLGIENLQQRSFNLAKWQLRQTLFGWQIPIPESLSKKEHRIFLLYAYSTWLYRFFLFIGIALLVYHFAFKILGIILFLIEIIYFVLLPISKEIMIWWQMKHTFTLNKHTLLTSIAVSILIGLVIFPWQQRLVIPAVLVANEAHHLYVPTPAVIEQIKVKIGDSVHKNDLLIALSDPKLTHEIEQHKTFIQILEKKLMRIASIKEERDQQAVLEASLKHEQQQLQSLQAQQAKLSLYAPIDGVITDMPALSLGQSVNQQTPLMHLMQTTGHHLIAFLPAEQFNAIQTGATGQFMTQSGEQLTHIFQLNYQSDHAITELAYPELSSLYQGSIDTNIDKQTQKLIPTNAYYQLRLDSTENNISPQTIRWIGWVSIEGKPMSYLERLWQTSLAVVIKESGF